MYHCCPIACCCVTALALCDFGLLQHCYGQDRPGRGLYACRSCDDDVLLRCNCSYHATAHLLYALGSQIVSHQLSHDDIRLNGVRMSLPEAVLCEVMSCCSPFTQLCMSLTCRRLHAFGEVVAVPKYTGLLEVRHLTIISMVGRKVMFVCWGMLGEDTKAEAKLMLIDDY